MTDLAYDERAAVEMLAALRLCPPAKRLDTLAAVVKVIVERLDPAMDAAGQENPNV